MRYQIHQAKAGSGSEYITLTSITVESAALYTINGLIFLVSYAVNSPIQNLALPVLRQTQVHTYVSQQCDNSAKFKIVNCSLVDHLVHFARACMVKGDSCLI